MLNDVVKVPVATRQEYILRYLKLRTFNILSETQYMVLSEIVKHDLIGCEERKEIRNKLGLSTYSFNNVLSALKKKRLILHDVYARTYRSNVTVPKEPASLVFTFEPVELWPQRT